MAYNSHVYTTRDVIEHWMSLERRGRHDLLSVENYYLHRRSWEGEGMKVDVQALQRWMDAYLERLARLRTMTKFGGGE